MIYALVVFAIGLLLSAFFSGSETGYYRVPRLRLLIDSVGGDRTARGLLWASNHPEAFVATALVGNNLANYFASSAIVAAAGALLPAAGLAGEMAMTLLLAPVVFIAGELLPKRAFLQAPYRLMRRCAGALALAGVVLAIPSSLLWLVSRGLSLATGSQIQPLRMRVRRRELADAFEEGEAVGLLSTAQRDLAMATFSLSGQPLRDYLIPISRQPILSSRTEPRDVLRLARSRQLDAWPVSDTPGEADRYVRASRLMTAAVEAEKADLPTEELPRLPESMPFLQALTELESSGHPLAAVTGAGGRVVGFVRTATLQVALWDAA